MWSDRRLDELHYRPSNPDILGTIPSVLLVRLRLNNTEMYYLGLQQLLRVLIREVPLYHKVAIHIYYIYIIRRTYCWILTASNQLSTRL